MATAYQKVARLERLEELTDNYRSNEIQPLITKILRAMGKMSDGINTGGLEKISNWGGKTHVTYTGSCRGSQWWDEYDIPDSIMKAEDPIAAALEWRTGDVAEKARKAEIDRQQKIAKLEQELNNLKG